MNAIEAVIAKRRAEAAAGQVAQTSGTWRSQLAILQGQLCARRKALRIRQETMATALGVGRRSFQRWEHGEAVPDTNELFRWADMLGIIITFELRAEKCATVGAQEAA